MGVDSHGRVMVVEIMGNKAGWLTLQSGIAGGADVVLIPEIPYDIDKVASKHQDFVSEVTSEIYGSTTTFTAGTNSLKTSYVGIFPSRISGDRHIEVIEGRLLNDRWWLDPKVGFGDVVFRPKNFTPQELADKCHEYRLKFYTVGSILKRGLDFRANSHGFIKTLCYYYSNFLQGHDVVSRRGLHGGDGL